MSGPPPGMALGMLADIPDGGAKVIDFDDGAGRREFFIQRRGEALFAYLNDCPHAHLPLDWVAGRFLDIERKHLLCANHGALFRLEDGYCFHGPCAGASLTPVRIILDDGKILTG